MEKFFCVYTFNGTLADFECVGTFTKREDAEAFAAERVSAPSYPNQRFPIVTRTFRELIDSEIKIRLGRLADILFPKEQAELDARQKHALESGRSVDFTPRETNDIACLNHGSPTHLPADVTRRTPNA